MFASNLIFCQRFEEMHEKFVFLVYFFAYKFLAKRINYVLHLYVTNFYVHNLKISTFQNQNALEPRPRSALPVR